MNKQQMVDFLETLMMPAMPVADPENEYYSSRVMYEWYCELKQRQFMYKQAFPCGTEDISEQAQLSLKVQKARHEWEEHVSAESNVWTRKFLGQDKA